MGTPTTAIRAFLPDWTKTRIVILTFALGAAWFGANSHVAEAAVPAPGAGSPSAPKAGAAEADIDAYWRRVFKHTGIAYNTPALVGFSEPISTGGCGEASPQDYTTFYCEVDDTVYYSVSGVAGEYDQFGDAGWTNMMAHEWGHHVQLLLGIIGPGTSGDGVTIELQATCLAGLYVENAVGRDRANDEAVAVMEAMFAGDVDHGSQDQLRDAFDTGFHGNLASCGVSL